MISRIPAYFVIVPVSHCATSAAPGHASSIPSVLCGLAWPTWPATAPSRQFSPSACGRIPREAKLPSSAILRCAPARAAALRRRSEGASQVLGPAPFSRTEGNTPDGPEAPRRLETGTTIMSTIAEFKIIGRVGAIKDVGTTVGISASLRIIDTRTTAANGWRASSGTESRSSMKPPRVSSRKYDRGRPRRHRRNPGPDQLRAQWRTCLWNDARLRADRAPRQSRRQTSRPEAGRRRPQADADIPFLSHGLTGRRKSPCFTSARPLPPF